MMLPFLLALLAAAAYAPVSYAFYNCTAQAAHLNADYRNHALLYGLKWPVQDPVTDYTLCYQVGATGAYVNVQLDTGSTGIVIDRNHIGVEGVSETGYCQSFLYSSSDNSYWGHMVLAPVTIFGSDTDGRHLLTQPMPVLRVEAMCKGQDCLTVLNGDQTGTDDCAYVQQRLASNPDVRAIWRVLTADDDGIAMMGVGYNRGQAVEGYLHPVPQTRNAALRINTDTLVNFNASGTVNSSTPNGIVTGTAQFQFPPLSNTQSTLCASSVNAAGYDNCADLRACGSAHYNYSCMTDRSDANFTITNTNTGISAIGYVITVTTFLPLIQVVNTNIASKILGYPAFSCVQLPTLTVVVDNQHPTQPGFDCYNANAVQGQNRILGDSSLSSAAVYQSQGSFLPDTGIQYEIYEPQPKPLLTGDHAIQFQFPVDPRTGSASSAKLAWTWVAELSNELPVVNGKNVTGYYGVRATDPAMHGPLYLRFINNTAVPLNQLQGSVYNQTGFMNTGRFLMADFAYFVDLQSGVAGFSPIQSWLRARGQDDSSPNGAARHDQSVTVAVAVALALSMISALA